LAEQPDRRQWLPAVIAVVLGLAIGAAIVTNGADSTPTASTLSSITTNPVVVGPGQPLPEVAAGAEPTTYLGDLGPVDTADRVRAAVRSAQGHGPVSPTPPVPCIRVAPRSVGLLVIGAYAVGTSNGESVTVLVGTAADGHGVDAVLRAADCTLVQRVETGS
jgi:hypothetical protein